MVAENENGAAESGGRIDVIGKGIGEIRSKVLKNLNFPTFPRNITCTRTIPAAPPAAPLYGEFTEEHNVDEIETISTRPPRFLAGIASYRIMRGVKLAIVCEVDVDDAVFAWEFNDTPIRGNSQKYAIEANGKRCSILYVSDADQGLYRCRATNGAGSATSYGYVTVLGWRRK